MIGNASEANKEIGEWDGWVASSENTWAVFEAYTPQYVNLAGDDTNDRLGLTLDFAVLFVG